MKHLIIGVMILSSLLVFSACSTTTKTNTEKKVTLNQEQKSTSVKATETSRSQKSNIIISSDPKAKETIVNFYQYLNEQKYHEAIKLLGPQLQFEGNPDNIKYLKNYKKATFLELKDISDNPGLIDNGYSNYYAIKIYYGKINVEVRDRNLVPTLEGMNYRKFILIKKDKTSPWLIDTDEATPPIK
ncbi:DUF4829 domain-containing protein [Pullulanibacillus sp. KACC 23026]|uniref:DUF4829 domain-containing protein n=1 Tax=Pullulanibacillus sp. KACC 23026 TaxID=3028315 RepID=UPI0023B15A4B|nr:DUF4829 domain-containing protein [Pullulanibacillus sp. KACC 23026]WEG12848.1 DUF4829 domain-containing protein [Pullulanibacillus sp. KACC 23026]